MFFDEIGGKTVYFIRYVHWTGFWILEISSTVNKKKHKYGIHGVITQGKVTENALHYLRSQKEKILIKVKKIPNYSSCRNKDFDFAPYAAKSNEIKIYLYSKFANIKIKIKKCNI